MADKKISALTAAATPLAGSEVLPIVQSGSTVKVSVDNLTAGKSVSGASFVPTGSTVPTNGLFLDATNSVSIATNSVKNVTVRPGGIMGLGTTPASWYLPGDVTSVQQVGANTVTLSLFGNQSHFGSNFYLKTGTGNDTYINTGIAMRYRQDGGAHVFESAPSGTADTTITFTPLATVAANGNFTVHTNNIIVGTAGKGIDFSANANAPGMTSELLTWYEVGTFTPTVYGSSTAGTQTYAWQHGNYTRVGNVVTCVVSVRVATTSGMVGNISIGGLPFTSKSGALYAGGVQAIVWGNLTAGQVYIAGYVSPSANYATLTGSTGATGNLVGLDAANFGAGSYVDLIITYMAA